MHTGMGYHAGAWEPEYYMRHFKLDMTLVVSDFGKFLHFFVEIHTQKFSILFVTYSSRTFPVFSPRHFFITLLNHNKDIIMFKKIKKRDERIVEFDSKKITSGIAKAREATKGKADKEI